MAGSAPRADVWVAVEHDLGWGDAALTRSGHGVRVLMARGRRADPGITPAATAGRRSRSTLGAGGDPKEPEPEPIDGAGVRVWVGYATGTPTLRVGRIASPEVVAGWDLSGIAAGSHREWGDPDPDPLLLVCANGRRDRCCGHEGGRLADALWRGPHRDRVLTCTHLGGHRFAPTTLLLPVGALHGRLDGASAADLMAQARTGRTTGAGLRGFSTLGEPEQVAEAHVRALTGYGGLAPLQVELAHSDDPDRLHAEVRGPDLPTSWVPLLRTHLEVQPSCGRPPAPAPRWTATP